MFTVSKDSSLTVELIEKAIKYNETERKRFSKLENYYRGKHEILNRFKPATAKNTKIVVNHASYIVDTNVGYLLGNPVEYRCDDHDIEAVIEQYKEQNISDLDHEVEKDNGIFGKQYELIYNVDNKVRSANVDVRNAVCVYDDTVEHKKIFGMIYKVDTDKVGDTDKIKEVVVYDDNVEYECKVTRGNISIGKEKPHKFGIVPLVEYRNNSEYQGDFEQVMSLIDAYNMLQSDRVNDKEQLVEAILAGYGINLTPEQMQDLLENRTMFGLPLDSKVEYIIKQLDEQQVDVLRQTLENDIHKISKVPNMSDENFVGNSSGVAIAYKLLSFNQNVMNKERYFETGLRERFEAYNNYLNAINKMPLVPKHEIQIVFKRNLPQNLLEISQMISNLTGLVDERTLLGQIPFVEDADAVIEAKSEEQLERYNSQVGEFGSLEQTTDTVKAKVDGGVKKKQDTLLEKLSNLLK